MIKKESSPITKGAEVPEDLSRFKSELIEVIQKKSEDEFPSLVSGGKQEKGQGGKKKKKK